MEDQGKSPDDFLVSKLLGEDEDSTVVLAQEITTGMQYAIKILDREKLMQNDKLDQVTRETEIIKLLKHPFFVEIRYTFEDHKRIYFVLSYASNEELLSYIEANTFLPLKCAQFYAAELVLALEYLSELKIIHRDLKPENILLTEDWHIQITDFGTAKICESNNLFKNQYGEQDQLSSFVGTAEYVPPELLSNRTSTESSDLWALGCIIYQMLTGKTPFHDDNDYHVFRKIIDRDFTIPESMDVDAQDLINQLLETNPNHRIGSKYMGGFRVIKAHNFFRGIDWENLHLQTPPAMGKPTNHHGTSISSFSNDQNSSPAKRYGSFSTVGIRLECSDPGDTDGYGLSFHLSEDERIRRLGLQEQTKWHRFADNGNLILKQAELEKKRGLSIKTRQFLLIEGPKFVYVDSGNMEIKGEIPITPETKTEVKSFKVFQIHVPGRSYHLIDKKGNAIKWCRKVDETKQFYFGKQT